ncbi:MAG: DUF3854 domain-containing protein [Bacteroidota bacterium]
MNNQTIKSAETKKTTPTNGIDHPQLKKFLKDTGLTPEQLNFRTASGAGDQRPRNIPLFYLKDNNVVIPYFAPDGVVQQFPSKGKLKDYQRIRIGDQKPGEPKYKAPYKSGAFLYFPPKVISSYQSKEEIKTLFLTEGEKKALAGCNKLDLPFVAMPGIFGLREKETDFPEINKDLQKVIERCQVKDIVIVFDADGLKCNYDPENPEKDLYIRANSFFRSITTIKELLKNFDVNIYATFINPNLKLQSKGLDDLLNDYPEQTEKIKEELTTYNIGRKEFTVWHYVTGQSDTKLREFLGMNNAEDFYNKHHDELKDHPFVLKRIKYQHNGEMLKAIKDNRKQVFWKAEKDRDGNTKGCKIVYRKFIHFLLEKGFRRFDLNSESFTFLQVEQNLITEKSETKIQDFVIRYIEDIPGDRLENDVTKDELAEKIYQSPQTYFSKSKLSLLVSSEFPIQRDTLTKAFVFLKNGFVEVTKEGYQLKNYSQLDNYIYSDQQQQRDFTKGTEDGVFKKFVQNISGYEKTPERFKALRSMLGYLMHDYHEYKLKAINFTDSKMSDEDEGRTGKTMLSRAIKYLRNYLEVPGKNFDATKDTKYQHASLTTQVVHLNDAQRSFKTEYVYNDITEGIEIKKLYDKPFFIRVKYIISSNKTLQVWGASARDRFVEFELADHYSDTYTPEHEFGQWFFRDWDDNEWNAFYNFMLECIRIYLDEGIIQADTINLEARKLINETNQEFVDFIESRRKENPTIINSDGLPPDEQEIVIGIEFNKKLLHEEFLTEFEEYRMDKYIRKQSTFTKWLKKYAKYNNFECVERKSGADRYMKFTPLKEKQ